MGKRGPLPSDIPPNVGDPDARVPQAPDRLSDWAKGQFRLTIREMIRRNIYQDADQLLVECYVGLLDTVRQCREQHAALESPLTQTGARGNQLEHPLLAIERRHAREADRIAASLLLTPNARVRTPVQGPDDIAELDGIAGLIDSRRPLE
jgi:P27 family predicted phage terminase small subunit